MNRIKFCQKCKQYTLQDQCDGEETAPRIPPKYSPDDKYGIYRRQAKEQEYKKRNLL